MRFLLAVCFLGLSACDLLEGSSPAPGTFTARVSATDGYSLRGDATVVVDTFGLDVKMPRTAIHLDGDDGFIAVVINGRLPETLEGGRYDLVDSSDGTPYIYVDASPGGFSTLRGTLQITSATADGIAGSFSAHMRGPASFSNPTVPRAQASGKFHATLPSSH
ncbi:MAG: hypothetical protein AAF170_14825 [Bacteroidota bacterium]